VSRRDLHSIRSSSTATNEVRGSTLMPQRFRRRRCAVRPGKIQLHRALEKIMRRRAHLARHKRRPQRIPPTGNGEPMGIRHVVEATSRGDKPYALRTFYQHFAHVASTEEVPTAIGGCHASHSSPRRYNARRRGHSLVRRDRSRDPAGRSCRHVCGTMCARLCHAEEGLHPDCTNDGARVQTGLPRELGSAGSRHVHAGMFHRLPHLEGQLQRGAEDMHHDMPSRRRRGRRRRDELPRRLRHGSRGVRQGRHCGRQEL
jgi:hypothetical protein